MLPLTPQQRRALRAKAHHLSPSVLIGQHGLTPAVLHEIDLALLAHDLIKVKAADDDRDARSAMLEKICAELDCAPVQQLGKMLVLWRPNPERKARKEAPAAARPAKERAATGRRPAGGGDARRQREPEPGDGRRPAGSGDARRPAATGDVRKPRSGDAGRQGKPALKPGAPMPYLSRRGAGRFVEATDEAAQAPATRRRLQTRKR